MSAVYKGKLIKKTSNGYVIDGQVYATITDATAGIK